jgi:hypothetical protein
MANTRIIETAESHVVVEYGGLPSKAAVILIPNPYMDPKIRTAKTCLIKNTVFVKQKSTNSIKRGNP